MNILVSQYIINHWSHLQIAIIIDWTGKSVRSVVCCWFIYRPQLLQVLIGLFELPQDTTAVTDDIPLMDPDADNAGMLYTVRR